jgi:hypothetical protein
MELAAIRIYPPPNPAHFRGNSSVFTMAPSTRARADSLCLSSLAIQVSAVARILGLPATEGWALVGAAVVAVALLLIWVILRLRRRSPKEDAFDSAGRLLH